MRPVAVASALMLLSLCPLAAQEIEKPWEDWEPPVTEALVPNAFDLYLKAFDLLEELGEPERDADSEEVRAALDKHALTFRLLEEAMMGDCLLPAVTSFDQTLPHLRGFRSSARLFVARANLCVEEGRYAEAALDCIACVRLGADAARGGPLIAGLVGIACEAIGLHALQDIIPGMQPDDCAIAIAALRAAEAERVTFAQVLESEALSGKYMMKSQFAQAFGETQPDIEALGLDAEQLEELKEQLEQWQPAHSWYAHEQFFPALIGQAQKPYWDRDEIEKPGDPLVDILVPVCTRTSFKFASADARLRLALVHLAAQAYLLDKGLPPADLEALVPEYLDMIPDDPFADGTLRSATRDGDFIIYSVGPDGADDGGTEIDGIPEPDSMGDIVVTP